MKKAALISELIIEEMSKTPNSQTIFGYLTIKIANTINIDRISGDIFFEARGRMAGQKENVLSFEICNHKIITKNELHKIPFSFQLHENYIDSYGGRNVNFSYKCEVIIEVDENDIDKIERGLFSIMKSMVTADKSIKISTYFLVEDSNSRYQVIEANLNFKLKVNPVISILVVLISGGLYACIMPEFNIWYLVLGAALVTLIVFAVTKYISEILSKVTMNVFENGESTFACSVNKNTRFKLTKVSLNYSIVEKVIDDRGTSSYTYSENVYISEDKKLSGFDEDNQVNFQYPQQKGLYTTEYMDAFLIWEMTLSGSTYFGIVLKYNTIFEVGKIADYTDYDIDFIE